MWAGYPAARGLQDQGSDQQAGLPGLGREALIPGGNVEERIDRLRVEGSGHGGLSAFGLQQNGSQGGILLGSG